MTKALFLIFFFSSLCFARFTSVDPAREFINPYNYAANNPLRYTDPTGEVIVDEHLKDNKVYQKLKSRFMQSPAGVKLWKKIHESDAVLTIQYVKVLEGTDSGTLGEVRDVVIDPESKKLISGTMFISKDGAKLNWLGSKLGEHYKEGATVKTKTEKAVYFLAHELGHFEQKMEAHGAAVSIIQAILTQANHERMRHAEAIAKETGGNPSVIYSENFQADPDHQASDSLLIFLNAQGEAYADKIGSAALESYRNKDED